MNGCWLERSPGFRRASGRDDAATNGATPRADLSLDVDGHWCPHIHSTTGYVWTSRGELEIAHNVWLGIEGSVGDKLKDQLNAAIATLQASVICTSVAKAVRDVWHRYNFPFSIPTMQPSTAYASFVPSGIGFSGLDYGRSDLALALSLTGTLGLSTTPPDGSSAGDLPPLVHISSAADGIALEVPVTVGYADASTALQRFFDGKTFEADTIAGHTKITVADVGCTLLPASLLSQSGSRHQRRERCYRRWEQCIFWARRCLMSLSKRYP